MPTPNKPTKPPDAQEEGLLELIGDYPFPLACYLQKIFDSEGNFNKLTTIFESLENMLAYLDLLLLASYYEEGRTDSAVEAAAKRLESPHLDDWFQFLETALVHLPVKNSLVQKIQNWYQLVEVKKEIYIQQILDYKKNELECGLLSNLKEVQNNIIPVMHIMLEAEINKYYDFCYISLLKLVKELQFLQNYILYFVENDGTLRRLMGADRNFPKMGQNIPPALRNQIVVFHPDTSTYHSLHPFIIYQECYYCIREGVNKDPREVFLWNGRTASRIIYHGCLHNVALREHLPTYISLQEKNIVRNIQATPPSISPKDVWERAFQATEETLCHLRQTKILRKYLTRRYPEFVLDTFRNNPKYPIFILSGSHGAGKTVLLAEMAKRWKLYGEIVLFTLVFGKTGYELEKDIARHLGILEWNQIPHSSSARWTIILDGVENTNNPEDFLQGVAQFAQKYSSEVRIILSISEFHLQLWQNYLEKPLLELGGNNIKSLIMPWHDSCLLTNNYYFHLPWFDKAQLKELYRTMCLEMAAPLTPFANFGETIHNMLCNPSLMSIFLACLKNREVPKVLSFNDMLEGYVLNQISGNKNRREFLEALLELLLQNKSNTISLDNLVESGNVLLAKESLACTSLSILTELTRDGILGRILTNHSQEKKAFLYFPSSMVREYLIYRSLALMGKHKDELLIEDIKEIGRGNETLYGVVFFALLRLANKQYFDRIMQILQETKDLPILSRYLLFQLLVLYKANQIGKLGDGGSMDLFVTSLITLANPVGYLALADFAMHLYSHDQFENAAYVLDKLSQNVLEPFGSYDPLILTAFAAYSWYKAGQLQTAAKLYKKVGKNLKKIEGQPREYELYLFLAKGHREIGDRERSEFFLKKVYEQREHLHNPLLEAILYEEAGYQAREQIDYPKALRYFQKQHQLLEQAGRKDQLGVALTNIAQIYAQTGNNAESIAFFKKAVDLLEEIGDSVSLAITQHKFGIVLADSNNFSEAKNRLVKSLAALENSGHRGLVVQTYLYLGKIYEHLKQSEQAQKYYTQSIDLLKELHNFEQLAECYVKFGTLEYKKGNMEKALQHFKKAEEYYNQSNNKPGLARVSAHLGAVQKRLNKTAAAILHFTESLRLSEELEDKRGKAECHTNLAELKAISNEMMAANEHITKAKSIYQELQDTKGAMMVQITQATIYHRQSQNTKAMECYEASLRELEGLHEKALLATVYNEMGLIYKERGDLYRSLEFFEKAAKIQEALGDLAGLSVCYNNIGMTYDARNEFEKALEYYNKDLEISEKLGDKHNLATSYHNIAMLHFNHHNYARSLWYLEKALALYQEINDMEMTARVQERITIVRQKL